MGGGRIVRVLYANHTGMVSGAERSLLDLLSRLPTEVVPVVACPPGRLAREVEQLGIPVMPIPEMDASLRLHPWHTANALVQVASVMLRLRDLSLRVRAQFIHANTIRAGLPAVLATKPNGPAVVVHLRDCLPQRSALARISRCVLASGASVLIANSRYTAARFSGGTPSSKLMTIYNPVNLARFSPRGLTHAEARDRLGLGPAGPVLGVIGQLAPWKGQTDAVRCLAALRSRWPTARLLLVGSPIFTSKASRYDNQAYAESIRGLGRELGLNGSLRLLGERGDIPEVLAALDLLLVPSWEEPFGRSVVEAMAMEVPVVATNVGGPAEIITDGVDGMLLPPREPALWASVIGGLLADPARRAAMGRRARSTVFKRFGLETHVAAIVGTYRKLLGACPN